MDPGAFLDGSLPRTLYHVGGAALPAGQVLLPNAVPRDYAVPLQLIDEALSVGARAAVQFLGGHAWAGVVARGEYPVEMVLLEAIFEHARRRVAPDAPSRYDAVFAWRTVELAHRFRVEYRPSGLIHRCTLATGRGVERDGALVVEVFEAIDLTHPRARNLEWMTARAAQYWLGRKPMAFPEVLVHGTVVVEGTVVPAAHQEGAYESFSPDASPQCGAR